MEKASLKKSMAAVFVAIVLGLSVSPAVASAYCPSIVGYTCYEIDVYGGSGKTLKLLGYSCEYVAK